MPCLEEKDLSELADQHVVAQKAVINNLRVRMKELEVELKRPNAHPDAYSAYKHLKLELDGEVPVSDGSMQFRRDRTKKTADERAELMAQLYRQRKHYVFHDTTKGGDPRTASMYGYPTIKEMIEAGHTDIAEEMIVRAASLVSGRSDGRNPVDFLNTEGHDVKDALGNLIEHHHIFNNVHVNERGRVEFKSFKIFQDSTGNLKMQIVPSYWNAEKHGKNTQFIGLMDGMHAGEDPVTHLHYYRFDDNESENIKAKIRRDVGKTIDDAKRRKPKLEAELANLEFRRQNPEEYERSLRAQIQTAEAEAVELKAQAKGVISKAKSKLSGDDLERREAYDRKSREIKQAQKRLNEHLEISAVRSNITATEQRIAEAEKQLASIDLRRVKKAEKAAARAEKMRLAEIAKKENLSLRSQKKLLKDKGDIQEQIDTVTKRLNEVQQLSDLTPESAVQMFEDQNGFFSFDKGFAEKADHDTYRPIMNEEINRFYVREAIEYMHAQHGDRYLDEMQKLAESRYAANLAERLNALIDKLPDAA